MNEIINKSTYVKCRKCDGKGVILFVSKDKLHHTHECCDLCNGTGQFKRESYIIVTQDKDGNKIAINSDQQGK